MVAMNLVALAGPASAATLVGDYQFQGSLGNSSGSAPSLTEFSWYGATGSFVSDTVLGVSRTVWSFPEGTGLVLNGASSYIGNEYSIVMLVKLNRIEYYKKLIDFRHSSGTDTGLYVNASELTAYGCGSATSTTNPIDSNSYQQIVMTRDSAKRIRLYVDGTQVASGEDSTDGCSLGTGNQIHFFVDDEQTCSSSTTGCEQTAGAVARLRLYNGAMTPTEVANLDRLPGQDPPPPPGGVTHTRSVTLALKKHLIATGTVSVPDGFAECASEVTVRVQKKTPSGFKTVASTVTSTAGTYKARLRDKPGIYRALTPPFSPGGSDNCAAAKSANKRHRH